MRTYFLELLFVAPKKGETPTPAISHVYVKTCTKPNYGGVNKDLPLITQQCLSFQEFEGQIDWLEKELKEIRRKAKKKYAAHEKRRQNWRKENED